MTKGSPDYEKCAHLKNLDFTTKEINKKPTIQGGRATKGKVKKRIFICPMILAIMLISGRKYSGGILMMDMVGVGGVAAARVMVEVRDMTDDIRKVDEYKAHLLGKRILIKLVKRF